MNVRDGAEERNSTRGAEGGGRRERLSGDGGRVKKKKRRCFCKIGHLVRWNYIRDAHAALMLLSHQHTAQAEVLYVGDYCQQSKSGSDLDIFTKIPQKNLSP